MSFVPPPRPPGPNPGQMAAQRAGVQAQRAALQTQQATIRAQQALRHAGASAYLATRQARRAGSQSGGSASTPSPSAGARRPAALAAALRVTLGGFLLLLIFAVVDRFAAPPQLASALLLYASGAVALLAGHRVVVGTGRLGAALLCGALLGLGMTLLGLLTFVVFAHLPPASALTLYRTRAEVGAIRTLLLLAGVALAGGAGARLLQLLRDHQV